MISFEIFDLSYFTYSVKALQSKLYHCDGVWRCCNRTEGSVIGMVQRHFVQLRLAIHHHSSTLYSVQPRILG